MIDPTKSIVIFSHPRSGSTWFQHSLKQYSLSELFNLNVEVIDYDEHGIKFKFDINGYDIGDRDAELEKRFVIYNYFEMIKKTVSVKIHSGLLNKKMIDFLKKKDVQVVTLERNNKSDVFWSLIIAWNLNIWHGQINQKSVKVTRKSFDRINEIMNNFPKSVNVIDEHFSSQKIYYEDLLILPDNDWFNRSKKYSIMNAKSSITIENLQEVNQWLVEENHQAWVMQ